MVRQYKQTLYLTNRENTMTIEQVQNGKIYDVPLQDLQTLAPDIQWKDPPVITGALSPTEVCQIIGDWYVQCSSVSRRQSTGQFFTPPAIAHYMASMAGALASGCNVLDPGAGVGMLSCALCEIAMQQELSTLSITAFEVDPLLYTLCLFTLSFAREKMLEHNLDIHVEVHRQDFINTAIEHASLWSEKPQSSHTFDLAILNPPYFKVNQKDVRVKLIKDIAQGSTNMYTMFMSLAAISLKTGGRFISITPRSFASGAYFKYFRHQFFSTITPEIIHIFDSRRSAFEEADVLQENIILGAVKSSADTYRSPIVTIARSRGLADLSNPLTQQVARNFIVDEQQKDPVLYLPTSDIDLHLLKAFKRWSDTVNTYGMEISTGPVVPFRSSESLTTTEMVSQDKAVPLLWLQHIHHMSITWPLPTFDKPQAIYYQVDNKLLVKNATQIILRRFSTKEEPRRITAAVLATDYFATDMVGLENHLNYLYRPGGEMTYVEAIGLAAFLNSSLVDRYFRILNGNTQVNATELRQLPLPPQEKLIRIGNKVIDTHAEKDAEATEYIIMDELREDLIVGSEKEDVQLPILIDSRIIMGKIQEAQRVLRDLGLPNAQQNEISALTLLALCNLPETASWGALSPKLITIHNMMGFMKTHYGRTYAENTREVVRRQVIHQFEQARIIDRNPDDPSRPTNSPNTCYALSQEAQMVLQQFGTTSWADAIAHFLEEHGNLWEYYQRGHQAIAQPLKLADGKQFYLTPGKHNELQIAIINEFGPNFAPGAVVLYVGDAANKFLVYEQKRLEQLGVPVTTHGKLPDVILYDAEKNWLYLVEAVTSHGPVSPKRKFELGQLLQHCKSGLIFVTAFLNGKEFKRHATQIAWETEVWIAEMPEHMLHYNGDRFMGPRNHPIS